MRDSMTRRILAGLVLAAATAVVAGCSASVGASVGAGGRSAGFSVGGAIDGWSDADDYRPAGGHRRLLPPD